MANQEEEILSVEQIDKFLDRAYTPNKAAAKGEKMSADKLKAFNLCAAYGKARPVLQFAKGLLFFKPKWQAVVEALISALDDICPQS